LRFNIYKDYCPTLTNFKPLYSSLLVYKQKFQRLYDFLADGIDNEFIPRADNKEGGQIKIFIDKIPIRRSTGTSMSLSLPSIINFSF